MTARQQANDQAEAVVTELETTQDARIQAKARAEMARRLAYAAAGLCLLATLVLGGWCLVTVTAGTAAIQSCTTPAGACYRDGQARTAAAIEQITRAQEDVAARGSKPGQETLTTARDNAAKLDRVLAILQAQYPAAAKAVQAELQKEGTP